MSNKKRNKRYRGRDAVPDQPVVKRYRAQSKTRFQIWYEDNKQTLKIRAIVIGLVTAVGLGLFSLFQWIF